MNESRFAEHETWFFGGDDHEPTIHLEGPNAMWGVPRIWESYVVFSHTAAIEYGFPYAVSLSSERTAGTTRQPQLGISPSGKPAHQE